jgi:ferric-dicitrate binding protein FerR (iron transport regulator)
VNNEEEGFAKLSSKRKWLFSALILFIAIALGTAIVIGSNTKEVPNRSTAKQTEEIYARPGTRTKLVLPDSSVVWLNAGSKLTYAKPFGIGNRVVTLSGEAFFDVAKNEKPFIIHTSGAQIKVLGTVFNVRNYPNEKKIETSLISGRVEITVDRSPEKKYVLKPNEKLTLNTDENIARNTKKNTTIPLAILSTLHYIDSSTIAETSWVENKLVFADESFADIAKKMERWYGITIHYKNEKIQLERFTGVFEKETVWQALEAMQIITPFKFSIKNNEITITH